MAQNPDTANDSNDHEEKKSSPDAKTTPDIFTNDCESVETCSSINRILNCLHFYQLLNEAQYHNLLKKLSDSEYPHLINDYNHILTKHIGDQKSLSESREEYEAIYKQISRFKALRECSIETCKRFTRNNRSRETTKLFTDNDNDLNINDNTESAMLKFYVETLDTIHCHLIHSFDCGFRLHSSDLYQVKYDLIYA